jgi:hypothetical protein
MITALKGKQKPESADEEEWNKRRTDLLGHAYFMAGFVYASQGKFDLADKTFREALPHVAGNAELQGGTLYLLSVANFNLGAPSDDPDRIRDAYRFASECVAVRSQFQSRAEKHKAALEYQYKLQ